MSHGDTTSPLHFISKLADEQDIQFFRIRTDIEVEINVYIIFPRQRSPWMTQEQACPACVNVSAGLLKRLVTQPSRQLTKSSYTSLFVCKLT